MEVIFASVNGPKGIIHSPFSNPHHIPGVGGSTPTLSGLNFIALSKSSMNKVKYKAVSVDHPRDYIFIYVTTHAASLLFRFNKMTFKYANFWLLDE
jgi:hypothetical protein